MTRIATTCALAASISLSAQTPQTQTGSISVTGCVAPVQRDGSLGAKPVVTPPPPDVAPIEANNPEPTGRFMLQAATVDGPPPVADKTAKPKPTAFTLRGHEQELAKHVGHRVQITGTLMPPLAAKLPAQGAESAEGTRGVQVSSIKMLAATCPGKP